jgi:hypothetical protein
MINLVDGLQKELDWKQVRKQMDELTSEVFPFSNFYEMFSEGHPPGTNIILKPSCNKYSNGGHPVVRISKDFSTMDVYYAPIFDKALTWAQKAERILAKDITLITHYERT